LSGKTLGNVSKALPDPNSYRPMGSQTPSDAFKAVVLAVEAAGAKADALAARAATTARESLAMVR